MDFTHRSTEAQSTAQPAALSSKHKDSKKSGFGAWTRTGYTVLLFAVTILIVAIAGLIAFGTNDQAKYVNTSKYQAVFLNNDSTSGQSAYVGHITKLTDKYIVLQNVYYLTPTTSAPLSASISSSYSLEKLGCQQLYGSYDQMIINQDQVASWENLQDSGAVVTAINQFVAQNPNGPNCSQTSISTLHGIVQNAVTSSSSIDTSTPIK